MSSLQYTSLFYTGQWEQNSGTCLAISADLSWNNVLFLSICSGWSLEIYLTSCVSHIY